MNKAPSEEGAVAKGDWGREFSPSVFCFAKATSLVRGRRFFMQIVP